MAESELRELSMEFSVDIINLIKYLKSNHESVIANQIGRSGTSIGANIHEAQYAQGKKDLYAIVVRDKAFRKNRLRTTIETLQWES